jgi:hypothetical protein
MPLTTQQRDARSFCRWLTSHGYGAIVRLANQRSIIQISIGGLLRENEPGQILLDYLCTLTPIDPTAKTECNCKAGKTGGTLDKQQKLFLRSYETCHKLLPSYGAHSIDCPLSPLAQKPTVDTLPGETAADYAEVTETDDDMPFDL